jgi:hypothetical protein
MANYMPPFAIQIPPADDLVVTPDEADAFVADLSNRPDVEIEAWPQFGGRTAYQISLGTKGKPHAFFSRPHAHEPAGTAACFELLRRCVYTPDDAWSQWLLSNFRLSVLPDANPGGSQRAPVKFWDGTQYPNQEFFLWMFGESGDEAGQRFPRVPCWDSRQVTFPALLGIAYEQIDAHTYIEPNRDQRSTFFKTFAALHAKEPVDLWLDMHQTEYVGSVHNCHINMPAAFDQLAPQVQSHYRQIGTTIHDYWRQLDATPYATPSVPYRNNPEQSQFLQAAVQDILPDTFQIITEVHNNNSQTPIDQQVRLQLAAIDQSLRYLHSNAQQMKAALAKS